MPWLIEMLNKSGYLESYVVNKLACYVPLSVLIGG